jgi:hypothetical protein
MPFDDDRHEARRIAHRTAFNCRNIVFYVKVLSGNKLRPASTFTMADTHGLRKLI